MKKSFVAIVPMLLCLLLMMIARNIPFGSVKATYAESQISGDVNWTLQNSPYIVAGDIVVNSNATLKIQPGVIVKFNENFSLTIYGRLSSIGTTTNRIIFTSNKPEPSAGDWSTIKFLGRGNSSFVLQYCVVEYALNGITIQSERSAVIENSEISNNLYNGIKVVGQSNLLIKQNVIKFNGNGIIGRGNLSSGLVVTNNLVLYNNGGVYIHTYGTATTVINNVTFSDNNFSHNKYGIFLYSGELEGFSESSYITNFVISNNLFSFGEYGIHVETHSWGSVYPYSQDNSYICNGVISNNTMFFNEYGIYLHSGGAWYRYAFNIILSGNVVSSSKVGMYLNAHHYDLFQFDVTLTGNFFSSNEIGVQILSGVNTNITNNSISYNLNGVMYTATKENLAYHNDIYFNSLCGMHVEDATANAKYNYWGNATGPYHQSLNPDGGGNQVNGNGTNLDFTPFLQEPVGRINEPPVPKLQADKKKVAKNQTIVIDASASSDDDFVKWYFFDFGDGTSSDWTTTSSVTHAYSSSGIHEVQLLIVDNLGVRSQEMATLSVNVTAGPIALVVTVSFSKGLLLPGEDLAIIVQVTDGDYPVSEAIIELSSDKDGTFSRVNGFSNSNGYLNATLVPPTVTTQTLLTITAKATKNGYLSGQGKSQVILVPPPKSKTNEFGVTEALAVAAAVSVVIAAVVTIRKRRSRAHKTSVIQ